MQISIPKAFDMQCSTCPNEYKFPKKIQPSIIIRFIFFYDFPYTDTRKESPLWTTKLEHDFTVIKNPLSSRKGKRRKQR